MIYELLPLLDGWVRNENILKNIQIKENNSKTLIKITNSGWIVGAGVTIQGSPLNSLNLIYHDTIGRRHVISTSPYSLKYGDGLVGSKAMHGATVTVADDSNEIYSMVYSPVKPIPFFASNDFPLEVEVTASNSDLLIISFAYEIIEIINKHKFVSSLREIIGGGVHGRREL